MYLVEIEFVNLKKLLSATRQKNTVNVQKPKRLPVPRIDHKNQRPKSFIEMTLFWLNDGQMSLLLVKIISDDQKIAARPS